MSSFPEEGHSPEDNIVLCFFMPMKWQKTAFVNSNKSLLKHTGKFAIFNLKVKIKYWYWVGIDDNLRVKIKWMSEFQGF